MNENHPYDKSLADKLKKLPVPDKEKSWNEMRRLLDNEMPPGSNYSKRRGGWWFFGSVILVLLVGSTALMTINFSRQNGDPPAASIKNTSPPDGDVQEKDVRINDEKPGEANDQILRSKENNKLTGEETDRAGKETTLSDRNDSVRTNNFNQRDLVPQPGNLPENTNAITAGDITSAVSDLHAGKTVLKGTRVADKTNYPQRSKRSGKMTDVAGNGGTLPAGPSNGVRTTGVPSTGIRTAGTALSGGSPGVPSTVIELPGGAPVDFESTLPEPAIINGIDREAVKSFALLIDSVNTHHLAYVKYAPVSRKYYRQNKKYGKPANVKEPYSTVGRSFAIGLALPLGFPLGDQKMLGYNINAGANTVTDYIPAPHVQYHFNSKSYIQSELQLMSPQFIRPVLLYQHEYSNSVSHTTNSIYARKLYYFNVPVSLHYSPFKHFYMGTGLQFSSLLSGVAMHEKIRTGMVSSDSIYSASYAKFSNDSISGKLNNSEMRLMLDANYYWNKFTVGVRYNQALSNYVSLRVAPSIPYTLDKNKSLQFYLRFNLWEDKKRAYKVNHLVSLK
jgi:hypothetical protein